MKKRIIAIVVALVLTASIFTGCSSSQSSGTSSNSTTTETKSAEGKKITALFFNLDGEFFNIFDTLFNEGLTDLGYEYESQTSNGNGVTMIDQINAASEAGSDLIWIWATNGQEVADACGNAMKNGSMIYAFVEDPGEGFRNVFRGSDSVQNGIDMAEMAIEWADKEYGDDASIRTVVITNEAVSANKIRGENVISTLEGDSRFDIIEIIDCEQDIVAAEKLTENIFAKYDDTIDCIITLAPALGVLTYLDSADCIAKDPERLGIFSTEINDELAAYMKSGLYDGTLVNGGTANENAAIQITQMDALMNGKDVEEASFVDSVKVTIDNLSDFGY